MFLKLQIVVVLVVFCFLQYCVSQKSPKEYAKIKCEKRIKNETLLSKCKECVENYDLSESATRSEIKALMRECIPKKNPKEWVKSKCEDNTEKQEEIEACFQCVDDYKLPENVTRDDVRILRRSCLPKPSVKFQAKRKCERKLRTKVEIESCQTCINNYDLPENASCEQIKEMKRHCVVERSGREAWTEPVINDDDDDDEET